MAGAGGRPAGTGYWGLLRLEVGWFATTTSNMQGTSQIPVPFDTTLIMPYHNHTTQSSVQLHTLETIQIAEIINQSTSHHLCIRLSHSYIFIHALNSFPCLPLPTEPPVCMDDIRDSTPHLCRNIHMSIPLSLCIHSDQKSIWPCSFGQTQIPSSLLHPSTYKTV